MSSALPNESGVPPWSTTWSDPRPSAICDGNLLAAGASGEPCSGSAITKLMLACAKFLDGEWERQAGVFEERLRLRVEREGEELMLDVCQTRFTIYGHPRLLSHVCVSQRASSINASSGVSPRSRRRLHYWIYGPMSSLRMSVYTFAPLRITFFLRFIRPTRYFFTFYFLNGLGDQVCNSD